MEENLLNYIDKLPDELIDIIKEYIPLEVTIFLNKTLYLKNHRVLKKHIPNYESYIRDMVRMNNVFVFEQICKENFKKWLFRRGILGWRHTFDCDNYAEAFRVYLQILHSKAMQKESDLAKKQSVAFGVIWYNRDKGGGHAINIFITKDEQGLVYIKYVEPQNGQIVHLSQNELNSIFFILI